MYVSSKSATGRVLAVAFAITLWGFGVPDLRAGRAQLCCPAQETQTCPVDAHAQHEAYEACVRQQKAYLHAQHEADEAQERAAEKRDKANALADNMCTTGEPDIIRTKPMPKPVRICDAAELQEVAASSNIFGLGVAGICDRGVIVTDVNLGSRAGLIGIRRDDVILAVNGVPVFGSDEFQKLVHELVGIPASFTVSRLGQVNIFVIDTR